MTKHKLFLVWPFTSGLFDMIASIRYSSDDKRKMHQKNTLVSVWWAYDNPIRDRCSGNWNIKYLHLILYDYKTVSQGEWNFCHQSNRKQQEAAGLRSVSREYVSANTLSGNLLKWTYSLAQRWFFPISV